MAVGRVTEVIGASPTSWEDAVEEAVGRASKSLRGITGLEITKMNASVKGSKIVEYRAHVNITFILEK